MTIPTWNISYRLSFKIMKFVNNSDLTKDERELILNAFEVSERSVSRNRHKIGCAILCENKDIFIGAVNERTKAIGSTCAERMAVDQLYFYGNKKPILCVSPSSSPV